MATVTTAYKERLDLKAESAEEQSFSFYIDVSSDVAEFTVQACVHTGTAYVDVSDVQRFATFVGLEGDISFGHTFKLNLPGDLADKLTTNNKRSTQMLLRYREDTKAAQYLPVPNVVMIDRLYNPQITDFSVDRYAFGEVIEDGMDALIKYSLQLTNPAVKRAPSFVSRLHYAEGKEVSTDSPYVTLADGIPINPHMLTKRISKADHNIEFSNTKDYAFMLWVGDDFENATQYGYIFEAFANLHMSGTSTGGVCVGGFSTAEEGEPKFECHFPAYFYGGIVTGSMKDYSTDETDMGVKWIDGRKIYRKIVEVGKIANSDSEDVPLNTGAMSSVISVKGIGYTSAGVIRPLPFVNPNNTTDNASLTVRNYASNPEIRINTGSSGALASALVVVQYTKPDPAGSENWLGYGKAGSMILG